MMGLIDFIFPKLCLGCGREGKYVCLNCLEKVRKYGWGSRGTYSIFKYERVIRKAILALKYKFAYSISEELSEICAREIGKLNLGTSIVLIPIPLHKSRQNLRGFNQTEEIGKKISENLGWKFIPKALVKNSSTKPQVGLSGKERFVNLKGTFALNEKYEVFLRGKKIVVFDDVYTTGSTLREASRVLKETKPKKIIGLTVAR